MTTQEQFEAWAKDRGWDLTSIGLAYRYPATDNCWIGWQACQDLNDKERESLIAENAMMREALEDVCNCNPTINFTAPNAFKYVASIEKARKALSVTPRLVEVGKVNNIGQVEVHLGALDDVNAGTNVYTIQTDTKSESKRKSIQRGE